MCLGSGFHMTTIIIAVTITITNMIITITYCIIITITITINEKGVELVAEQILSISNSTSHSLDYQTLVQFYHHHNFHHKYSCEALFFADIFVTDGETNLSRKMLPVLPYYG